MSILESKGEASIFFAVRIGADLLGSFLSVSGITHEIDMHTFNEGGRNTGPLFFPNGPTQQKLILERGVVNLSFYNAWMAAALTGSYTKLFGSIEMYNSANTLVHLWTLSEVYPVKIEGPVFNSTKGDVATEKIEILHTGILQVF